MKNLNFRVEKLIPAARTCLNVCRQTIDQFTIFGITAENLDHFESLISEAENIRPEEKERIDLKMITALKDEVNKECYDWVRRLHIRVKISLGKGSAVYKMFPAKSLLKARHNDNKMVFVMEEAIEISEENATELLPHGQTPDEIQKGKDLLVKLRKTEYDQEHKKRDKKKATFCRNKLFKEIYDTVNKLNEMGRNIFSDDPENLLLFESPWPTYKKHKPKTFEGSILPENTIIVTEDLSPDTLIHVENTGSTDLLIFVNTNGETPEGSLINSGTELTAEISELGEGRYLKLFNNDKENTGTYMIEI